jgi:hypothetical protein
VKKSNTDEFIEKAKDINGDKYDYSKVDYISRFNKVIIICPIHGEFKQTPGNHLSGFECKECGKEKSINKKTKSVENFIKECQKLHGSKYDYSKVEYIKAKSKVKIICYIHGLFFIRPDNHLNGQGCPKCGIVKYSLSQRDTTGGFVKKSKKIHGDKYDYTKTKYVNHKTNVEIVCSKHGSFFQMPRSHLTNGSGCPMCNQSKGEIKILNFIKKNNIECITQKMFDDCRNPKTNRKLRFDFHIPSKNLLIEYDGIQHFEKGMTRNFITTEEDLIENQYKDKLKTEYAKSNNIKLLRIKYVDLNKIDDILEKKLKRII